MDIICMSRAIEKCPELLSQTPGKPRNYKKQSGISLAGWLGGEVEIKNNLAGTGAALGNGVSETPQYYKSN